jgi:anti-sigma-K factor RskA
MSTHPRIPDDVATLITAYALGALEADQAALAEEHIAASDDCRRAYEDALETAAALALAVSDREPPAALRDRIVAAARAERPEGAPVVRPVAPRRRPRLAGLFSPSAGFAVLGVAAAIVFALIALAQHDSNVSASDREAMLVSILAAPGAHVVPVTDTGGAPRGSVIVADGRAALVTDLREPPSGRTYQAWGLPKDGGKPVPLPTFSRPGAVVIVSGVDRYAKLAVTEEPSGGSQVPSAAPFAAATL